jgi:drug/metabolite transporter (DMT)-like permease
MNWKKTGLYAGITLAMCFWAFSFIWYKQAFIYLKPIPLVFFRLIVASAFLSLIMLISGKLEKIKRKDIKMFILMSFFEPFLYFICESYGMTMVSSTTGSVIIAFIPLLTPFAALVLLKERINWFNISGIIIGFAGVILVITDGGFKLDAPALGVILMFMAVLAVVSYSGIIVYLAKNYKPLTIIWMQNLIGGLMFIPLFLILGLKDLSGISLSWEMLSPVIKLGIFPSALAFILFTRAIRDIGIVRANIFTNFIPVFTAILSFIILKEEMTSWKIAGIFIVLAGLLISQRKRPLGKKLRH